MIRLELPRPISSNLYWRHSVVRGHVHVYISPKARQYRQVVMDICAAQSIKPLSGRLAMTVDAYLCDKRADLGNVEKVLSDALECAHVFENDQQLDRIVLNRFKAPHRKDEKVIVTITEIASAQAND